MLVFIGYMNAQPTTLTSRQPKTEVLFPNKEKEEAVAEVETKIIRGLILIEGRIANRQGYFILDTGSPDLIVNNSEDTGHIVVSGSSLKDSVKAYSIEVKDIQVGNQRIASVEGYSMDLSHLERYSGYPILGLIGYQKMKDQITFIDYQAGMVSWFDTREGILNITEKLIGQVKFDLVDHVPVFTLNIQGKAYRFIFDTGSSINLIQATILDQITTSVSEDGREVYLEDLAEHGTILRSFQIESLLLDNLTKENIVFHSENLENIQAFLGVKIDGIIGFPFFKDNKFTIDYKKQEIKIWD